MQRMVCLLYIYLSYYYSGYGWLQYPLSARSLVTCSSDGHLKPNISRTYIWESAGTSCLKHSYASDAEMYLSPSLSHLSMKYSTVESLDDLKYIATNSSLVTWPSPFLSIDSKCFYIISASGLYSSGIVANYAFNSSRSSFPSLFRSESAILYLAILSKESCISPLSLTPLTVTSPRIASCANFICRLFSLLVINLLRTCPYKALFWSRFNQIWTFFNFDGKYNLKI